MAPRDLFQKILGAIAVLRPLSSAPMLTPLAVLGLTVGYLGNVGSNLARVDWPFREKARSEHSY